MKKNITIAIDFDGTCVSHRYPKIGNNIGAISVLKKLVEAGHKLILWTIRDGESLEEAINWFKTNDIRLYGIQNNPSQTSWSKSRKVYANYYIDDAALGTPLIYDLGEPRPYVDWEIIEQLLISQKLI